MYYIKKNRANVYRGRGLYGPRAKCITYIRLLVRNSVFLISHLVSACNPSSPTVVNLHLSFGHFVHIRQASMKTQSMILFVCYIHAYYTRQLFTQNMSVAKVYLSICMFKKPNENLVKYVVK